MIHLAFNHESAFSGDFAGAADTDRQVVEAFGEVVAGSDRPFLIASGVLGLALGQVANEHDGISPDGSVSPMGGGPLTRMGTAQLTINLAEKGIRSSAVRLPPTCHGDGDNGFMATLVEIARAKGVAGYIGDGSNRWPATHRLDVAHIFSLALDHAPAGSALHAVAEEGVPTRQVAEVIGRHLNVPVHPLPLKMQLNTSGSSPCSSALTHLFPAPSVGSCSTGSPPVLAWSPTWTRATTSMARQ